MIISILNCDKKWGIGKRNGLLFNLPLDMKFFRETTKGHVVCMGENTLLSFPGSKPLKNRTNIVLSQDPTHNYEGVVNVHTFEEFLSMIKKYSENDDVFVIGGASIYRQTLPYVDEVLLTKVNKDGGAEVFFPNLDEMPEFECVDEGEPLLDGDIEIRFTKY
jgi:dihydrofolate reductase